ncbi:hypothetical protein QBD01_004685 [Ochrobactrum sp. 19YEA23]|nr:hypothetical protein [Ochrobactrum sp. RH2CCR150]MDH7788639.1 hypothetical protein [Ochrobactrum sp. 19YEA23]
MFTTYYVSDQVESSVEYVGYRIKQDILMTARKMFDLKPLTTDGLLFWNNLPTSPPLRNDLTFGRTWACATGLPKPFNASSMFTSDEDVPALILIILPTAC